MSREQMRIAALEHHVEQLTEFTLLLMEAVREQVVSNELFSHAEYKRLVALAEDIKP